MPQAIAILGSTEQRNEFPPLHSITSSARASSVDGTVRPSAFAVLKLITNLNLVGSCTGRSAGLAPLQNAIDVRGELGFERIFDAIRH
jgi:hypothetical protein